MPITIRRPVTRKKLSDTVEEELERIIRQGELAEGDLLPSERELMETFGVGRPSIRDALSALSRKGLVIITSGKRTRVTRPSADKIISELSGLSKDFLAKPGGIRYFEQLRLFFESSLVRFAAERATDEQIHNLEEALNLNEDSLGHHEQFAKTDINFHRIIAEIPDNPIFLAIHQALLDWVISVRPTRNKLEQHEIDLSSYKAHRKIYENIHDRYIEGADQALKQHLQDAYDNYYDREN